MRLPISWNQCVNFSILDSTTLTSREGTQPVNRNTSDPQPTSRPIRHKENTPSNNEEPASANLILIEPSEVFSLHSRPKLISYLKAVWSRRHFILLYARSQSLRSGHDTYLGHAWILLTPVLQIAVYGIVFGLILHVSRGMDNFIGFLTIGVIFFGMLRKGLKQGTNLIRSSRNLIGAFSFPRASLVLSTSIKQFIDDIAPALVAIVGALAFQPSSFPGLALLLTLPLFLLLHVMSCGLTFIVSRLTAFVPDFKGFISTFQRGLFFFSGVFYDVDRFADVPILRELMLANPFYQYLKAFRSVILDGQNLSAGHWGYLILWSFLLLAGGFAFFWQAEERYAQVK